MTELSPAAAAAQHSITPPPELFRQLADLPRREAIEAAYEAAYRAGADQELDACCEWFVRDFNWTGIETADTLRAARRPKPLSLKELALEALDRMDQFPTADDQHIIRRALEALPE